jgi:hypothetical protein
VPIEPEVFEVDIDDRRAVLRVEGLEVPDYFTAHNALVDGAQLGETPGTVSFEIHWSGGGAKKRIGDGVNFEADIIENVATASWHGEEKGFHFESRTSTLEFAEIGTERNGVFL